MKHFLERSAIFHTDLILLFSLMQTFTAKSNKIDGISRNR